MKTDPYIKAPIGQMEKNTSGLLSQILTFLVLVGLFSLIAESLKFHLDQQNTMLDRLTMWGPGTAALITCWLYRIDVKTLGWRWPTAGWMPLSYVIPFLYATPVYLVTWMVIDHSLALQPFMDSLSASYNFANRKVFGTFFVGVPLLLTLGVVSTVTWALGEELGWRGFLFPRLVSRFGFYLACLFSGFIWAAWHYPGLIWDVTTQAQTRCSHWYSLPQALWLWPLCRAGCASTAKASGQAYSFTQAIICLSKQYLIP